MIRQVSSRARYARLYYCKRVSKINYEPVTRQDGTTIRRHGDAVIQTEAIKYMVHEEFLKPELPRARRRRILSLALALHQFAMRGHAISLFH